MRQVGLQELCRMPVGTLFAEVWQGCNINDIQVFDGAIRHDEDADPVDFFQTDLIIQGIIGMEGYDEPEIGDTGRWGSFDPTARFLVYEQHDVDQMRALMATAYPRRRRCRRGPRRHRPVDLDPPTVQYVMW